MIGEDHILAFRKFAGWYWKVERLPDEALVALLSLAYGRPLQPADPPLRAVMSAVQALGNDIALAARNLADCPPPPMIDGLDLALAERLLKSGTPPARLASALRRAPLRLPPAPDHASLLTLSEDGVVLGNGAIIAALEDRPHGGTGLQLEGQEERIVALLSIAQGKLADGDKVLRQFACASRALQKGDSCLAAIALCQLGQPRLDDDTLTKSLGWAAEKLNRGHRPMWLLKQLGVVQDLAGELAWTKIAATWDPDLHPRQGAGAPNPGWFAGKLGEMLAAANDALGRAGVAAGEAMAELSPAARAALGRLAGVATGPVGLAGGLILIPSATGGHSSGDIPAMPGVSYDRDETNLTVYRTNDDGSKSVLYSATEGLDGKYRTADGAVIGSSVSGDGVVIDATVLENKNAKEDKGSTTADDKGDAADEQKERKENPPKAESPVWNDPDLRTVRPGVKRDKDGNYYKWDHRHNDIEMYNKNGKHKGSVDPVSGLPYKDRVPGRDIEKMVRHA